MNPIIFKAILKDTGHAIKIYCDLYFSGGLKCLE